jgi:glycerol-3-phosphate dehydrogenase
MAMLGDAPFDLVIIGGGITGAGIARDAAMRGLRTLLLERSDIASGTSSASSKLVHGGLRYLEQGAVALVHESVSERHRLQQLAPHLVRPLPFLFPIYERSPRPLWQIRFGLWIYDAMALFRSFKLHKSFGARGTAEIEPALLKEGLDGSVLYYDCMTDDARLTLETARGAHLAGAWVMTYAEVHSFTIERRRICGVTLEDGTTGKRHQVDARVVVNATGPWTDRTLGLRGSRSRLLRPTKGVHLVFHRDRLPIRNTVCLMNKPDHRVIFAIPWGNRVVLGTTDTDFDGDFDDVFCGADDVRYLIKVANHYFPDAGLVPEDVLGTWAGLRPLVCPEEEGLGASQVSREHMVEVADDGLITVAGGKLTTYRLMADEVVREVARQLKAEGIQVGGCPTGSVLLPGGDGVRWEGEELVTIGVDGRAAELELEERLGKDVAEHLQESYGGCWQDVIALVTETPSLGQRIVDDLPYLWAEVDYAVEGELVITLRDFMRRRTQLEIRDAEASWAVAPAIGERIGALLGWSEAHIREQVADYLRESGRTMAWRDAL